MKTINLSCLISLYKVMISPSICSNFEKYIGADYNIEIKDDELDALSTLLSKLYEFDSSLTIKYLSGFYLGYKIPQIGKEFDLLRISDSCVLNIEYKREVSDLRKIEKQLKKNFYYLKLLNRNIYSYTYVEKEDTLFKLCDSGCLVAAELSELISVLKLQVDNSENIYEGNLNSMFLPSNYLISPFNKTNDFLNGNYFLTLEQEEKENILYSKLKSEKFFLIEGCAGSGKTLFTYHIIKNLINNGSSVGIIHCGQLNSGHVNLRRKAHWNIQTAKFWKNLFSCSNFPDVIVIDEVQRIREDQLRELIEDYILPNNIKLIMCGDENQILHPSEGKYKCVLSEMTIVPFSVTLTSKIRTNKNLANFIKVMLDLGKRSTTQVNGDNISISYFSSLKDANDYIETKKGYDYISYTPSLYTSNPYTDLAIHNSQNIGNSHEVIGQEFENVIVMMTDKFFYNKNKLNAVQIEGVPYITIKMFFQQITRAISNLEIVVVNNIDVYKELISIFS